MLICDMPPEWTISTSGTGAFMLRAMVTGPLPPTVPVSSVTT